jgi:hypothetical protein
MDFCSTHDFSMKKVDDNTNFAAGGIINHRTHHNSLCSGKNKPWVTSYVMVYKAMSYVMLPHMGELFPTPTFVA